jgi:hypothetical protein
VTYERRIVEQETPMRVVDNLPSAERVSFSDRLLQPRTSLVNLTGRTIVLCAPDGEPLCAFPPSDRAARARHVFTAAGATREKGFVVPLYRDILRLETDLPDPSPGVQYIVDYDVALACIGGARSRRDLLVPNGGVVDPTTGVLHVASLAIAGLLA